MNKILNLLLVVFFTTNCSFNSNSTFWSGEKSLELGLIDDYGEMKSVLKQRFGENVKIKEFAPKKKLFGFSNLLSGAIEILIFKMDERRRYIHYASESINV